ncbi:uncharacterized protein At4g17910 isoform X1 [Phalaenopsis equestris]|uniref:uncharacterized protein At4g17910 isoform X1 n=1 Tax=Phalaenopsis equestris TaxID=78828 RepID=UPI0009E4333B|nr:uncharacterized protein At4g17910 isoform X1 [Phalaenopsis equestris]
MDLSEKSLNPNKRLKEDFVSNLTGSSMLEIATLLLIVPTLVLLRKWISFGSVRGLASTSTNIFSGQMNDRETSKCKDLWNSIVGLTKDFAIVILPVILVFTVLAEWIYILAIILIIVLLICILSKRPSRPTLKSEIGQQNLSSSRMSILSYRVFMVVITCICILAVDFKIFPRRYAKTETYGTSLMDLGVGSFVVANSLVSKQARGIMFVCCQSPRKPSGALCRPTGSWRRRRYHYRYHHCCHRRRHLYHHRHRNWKVALQSVSPLVLLGAGRLIFTAGVEYQVHVGEYGVHWNFFFTLAAVSLLTSIIHIHPKYCGIFGMVILIAYQMSLKYGLSNFLLSSQRASDIISQNKEGFFSIFGYWGMYLIGVHLGYSIFFVNGASINTGSNQLTRKSVFILCIFFWSLTLILDRYVERVSRRMCNLAYVTLVLAQNFQVLSVFMLSEYISVQRPLLVEEVFNQNLLGSFLLANVLTGLVNLSIDTLSASSFAAVSILIGYMLFLTAAVSFAWFHNLKFKFW